MAADDSADQFKATQMFDEIVWHFRAKMEVRTSRKDLVMTAENSFTGKDALEFLLEEVPRIVPGKDPTRENMANLLGMMLEWKVIAEAFPKKHKKQRVFSESRIYVFAKSIDELKKPKPRSRRSASFSGARRSINVSQPSTSAATMQRPPKMSRRLSRSNENMNKAGVERDPRGVENHGFEDKKEESTSEKEKVKPPKILNRSLESICAEREKEQVVERKEKVYDWLPFFKSKRFSQKVQQPARRSVSMDRNHCILELEKLEKQEREKKTTPPPMATHPNDVFMNPQGPVPRHPSHRNSIVHTQNSVLLTRGRMYESIMRRSSVAPMDPAPPIHQDFSSHWKTQLVNRLEVLNRAPLPPRWVQKIDGQDIQWNSQELDGAAPRSRFSEFEQEYTSIVQFMDFLGSYPFSASMKGPQLVPDHNVPRMFSTLVHRLDYLTAPLYVDECDFILSLLTKLDNFAEMLEMKSTRRWSKVMSNVEEPSLLADGFIAREVPTVRSSKNRRRALSPLINRMNLPILDEKEYKLEEPWLMEAIQLILLALPPMRRRKLHKFVIFINSVATNHVFDIADPSKGSSNNREAALIGLWTGVCGGFQKMAGMLITAVLVANHRQLFSVPSELVGRIHLLEQRSQPQEHRTHRVSRRQFTPDTTPKTCDKEEKSTRKGLFTRFMKK